MAIELVNAPPALLPVPFSKRFIDGLEVLGHDKDIVALEWFVCGSDHTESTKALFRKHYPANIPAVEGIGFPARRSHCVCREPINGAQCWITDGSGETMTIGASCCLKAFLSYKGKTCPLCRAPHRQKGSEYCKACAVVCRGCPREVDPRDPLRLCATCLRSGKCPCGICRAVYTKPKSKPAVDNEEALDICVECLKKHCADCGKPKPFPQYRICLPCRKSRDEVGNKCEECGKPCGSYKWCYTCKGKPAYIEPEARPEAFYKRHRDWFPNGVRE